MKGEPPQAQGLSHCISACRLHALTSQPLRLEQLHIRTTGKICLITKCCTVLVLAPPRRCRQGEHTYTSIGSKTLILHNKAMPNLCSIRRFLFVGNLDNQDSPASCIRLSRGMHAPHRDSPTEHDENKYQSRIMRARRHWPEVLCWGRHAWEHHLGKAAHSCSQTLPSCNSVYWHRARLIKRTTQLFI